MSAAKDCTHIWRLVMDTHHTKLYWCELRGCFKSASFLGGAVTQFPRLIRESCDGSHDYSGGTIPVSREFLEAADELRRKFSSWPCEHEAKELYDKWRGIHFWERKAK